MRARLDFFNSTVREKGWRIGFHQHACYELVYYFSGKGETVVGENGYRFGGRHFSVIAPMVPHNEKHEQSSDIIFCGFQLSGQLRLPCGFYSEADAGDDAPVCSLLQRMQAEFAEKRPMYADKLDLLMSEIVIELCRMGGDAESEHPDTDKLRYVRNYMNEHFRQKLKLEELAALAGYSVDRFRHLFKEVTGRSPHRYMLDKRMEYARSLLRHSELPVSEIALDAGFSNDAQFCHLFKREHGSSPRRFRHSAAKGSE